MPRIDFGNNGSLSVPTAMQQLNAHMARYEREEISKLNTNVLYQEKTRGNQFEIAEYLSDAENWMEIPHNEDAFMLNPSQPALVSYRRVPARAFVTRKKFGYSESIRLGNGTYENFVLALEPVLLSIVSGLKERLGFGPEVRTTGICYISSRRPGSIDDFFRPMDAEASYELRFYSDCVRTNIRVM